jgi:5'-nucleotidase
MNDFGDVVVVAPDSPQSGKSNSITIESPIRCEKIIIDDGPQAEYACSGTPVDCVKLSVNQILKRKPDLCVSGINHGSNSSINVIYSGTMSAAIEGALENIPSIGFSLLDYDSNADFSESIPFIKQITKKVIKHQLDTGICLNVNIPKSIIDKRLNGIKVCRQANANWEEEFDTRIDPKGKKYYWLTGKFVNYDNSNDTDEWALANHYISIVPVQFDVTAHSSLLSVNKLFLDE